MTNAEKQRSERMSSRSGEDRAWPKGGLAQPSDELAQRSDEPASPSAGLSHVDARGRARMVDVGDKAVTERFAAAEAWVRMAPETLAVIESQTAPKGDVLAAARLAGIMAAKRTHELIPLCHPLALTFVGVDIEADKALPGLRIATEVRLTGKTGAEMEALTAAAVAALTVYDMCKAMDRSMEVVRVRLIEKRGGKSGAWHRTEDGR